MSIRKMRAGISIVLAVCLACVSCENPAPPTPSAKPVATPPSKRMSVALRGFGPSDRRRDDVWIFNPLPVETPTPEPTVTYNLKLDVPVVVGALRDDGSLVPFATFDGRVWENNWPTPVCAYGPDKLVLPSLQNIPSSWWGEQPPVTRWWRVRRGADPNPIAVTGTSVFEGFYGSVPALLTDYEGKGPLSAIQEPGSFAVAISAPDGALPIDVIDQAVPGFGPLSELIHQLVAKMEPDLWKGRDIERAQGRRVPKITSATRSRLPDGRRLIAFRAESHLERVGMTVLEGWIHQDSATRLTVADIRAFEGDPDGKDGSSHLLPEAVLTIEGHVFRIGKLVGFEGIAYFVMDVGHPERILLLGVDGTGC